MTSDIQPLSSPQHAADILRQGQPLRFAGLGSKRAWSRQDDVAYSTAAWQGIDYFYPSEMVVRCQAGTRLTELQTTLAQAQHRLAFTPPSLAGLLGTEGDQSIGGVIASNLAGHRRAFRGGVRDHLLGVEFLNGQGEAIKSGGRVMKNVSGYDLCKLMTGSFGSLGLLTHVTLKTSPIPEARALVCLHGLSPDQAMVVLLAVSSSPYDPVSAQHLDARLAGTLDPALPASLTSIEIEGLAESVAYRAEKIQHLASRLVPGIEVSLLRDAVATTLAEQLNHPGVLFAGSVCLWRLKPKPSQAARLAQDLAARFDAAQVMIDWGGNLVWLASSAEITRQDVSFAACAATQIKGAEAQAFQPLDPAIVALQQGIKQAFDPKGLLNVAPFLPQLSA